MQEWGQHFNYEIAICLQAFNPGVNSPHPKLLHFVAEISSFLPCAWYSNLYTVVSDVQFIVRSCNR